MTAVHAEHISRRVPMLDRVVGVDGHRDPGALFVAATWLWTRFDEVHNSELAAVMARNNCAPTTLDSLKMIDAALRLAVHVMFDDLLRWCRAAAQDLLPSD